MLKITPTCSECNKEIKGNDVIFVKMHYPIRKGFTEIKAYLQNEGTIICEDCFHEKSN